MTHSLKKKYHKGDEMPELTTILDEIKKKAKLVKKPVMILMGYASWERMVKEENLTAKFCTNCKNFTKFDNKLKEYSEHCNLCSLDKEEIITRELTILTIEDIPFQVTDRVRTDEVKVI